METSVNNFPVDASLRQSMLDLFPHVLESLASYSLRKKIVAHFIPGAKADDKLNEYWQMARPEAVNECWAIFMSMPEKIRAAFEEAQDELAIGAIGEEDISKRVCEAAVSIFVNRMADGARDGDYAGLREAISRMRDNRERVFITEVHKKYAFQQKNGRGMGLVFSPVPVTETPEFLPEEMSELLPGLGDVDPAIRKSEKAPIASGGGNRWSWDWKIVKVEANRFWRAFVDQKHGGVPCFVPLYAMYCWIKKRLPMGEISLERLDAPLAATSGEDEWTLGDTIQSANNVENAVFMIELDKLAEDIAGGLSQQDAAIFVYLQEFDGNATETAKKLRISDASVSRHFKFLRGYFQEKITQYAELLEEEAGEIFLEKMKKACKKRILALKV